MYDLTLVDIEKKTSAIFPIIDHYFGARWSGERKWWSRAVYLVFPRNVKFCFQMWMLIVKSDFCVSVFPQGQSYLIIFKQSNLTFVCVVSLTFTVWWSWFITVPSDNFDVLKLSIRLVDPQDCNNQIWLWCLPLLFCRFSAQQFLSTSLSTGTVLFDNFQTMKLNLCLCCKVNIHHLVIPVHHCTKCQLWYVKIVNKTGRSTSL